MISIVIRNKNEGQYLKRTLSILTHCYKNQIDEIIVVDNNSNDDSVLIAESFGCIILKINDFTYGKAINLGISESKNNYVLLLSAHCVPQGKSFFENSIKELSSNKNVAGLRFINSMQNYERAISNEFVIKDPLRFGLMAACCFVVKDVWKKHKFDESLEFSEDKEWSLRVYEDGFSIREANESFIYYLKRNTNSSVKRYENETFVKYKLFNIKPPNPLKVLLSLLKKIIVNSINYFKKSVVDFKIAIVNIKIYYKLGK